MRNYGKLRRCRHAIKGGQIKMYSKKRGYYFKKKEQKRDGHAWRCKKHARFFDKEAGTFWGLPLDKPWFICSFYKGGEVMNLVEKVRELEGKLLALKNVCRQEMDKFDEMKKECEDNLVINYDEEFLEGRAEFAEEIFCNYL